jgi:ketosteroid isomerase-like protein
MIKHILYLAILILACASFAGAQGVSSDKITKEFMDRQRSQDDAEDKKDIAALDRFFNDDFIFIAANGSIYDKKKFLDEIKADTAPPSQQKLEYEDFKARVYGQTAIVNYVVVVPGKDAGGKDIINRFRLSVIWVKNKGNWRITNFHSTRVRT